MFFIEMQFIPNMDVAWVQKVNSNDPVYQFDNYEDAYNKMIELEKNDTSGRKYRIGQISI
jgi:uncharacterized membrane protein (UPF0127 family)